MSSADSTASAGPRLLGPADVRSLAASLGIRPTKQRGQNFVIDPNTVRRIVRAAGLAETGETVLEIGPGLGSLTLALLAEGHRVVAVEIDPALAAALPATVARYAPAQATHLAVLEADALDLTPEQLNPSESPGGAGLLDTPRPVDTPEGVEPAGLGAGGAGGAGPGVLPARGAPGVGFGAPSACVANLPYNVAVPVLLHLLEICPSLRHGLVMVQAEVADRLAAGPGSRTYGVPSAKAAWYADVRRAGAIGRNVFWPAPNVDSGLVAFTRREPPATEASREQVFAVIDAAFSQRRKTVRSALARWLPDRDRLDAVLGTAGVDPTARGETLSIHDFTAIAAARGH